MSSRHLHLDVATHLFQLCFWVDRHLTQLTVKGPVGDKSYGSCFVGHPLLNSVDGSRQRHGLDPALWLAAVVTVQHLFVLRAWFSWQKGWAKKKKEITTSLHFPSMWQVSNYKLPTTTVSLQLRAWIDRDFAGGTVKAMFFVVFGLLDVFCLHRLVFSGRGAFLSVAAGVWTVGQSAVLLRWTIWGCIRELRVRGDLWGQLRTQWGILRWRIRGIGCCRWTALDVRSLLLSRLRNGAWA